MAEADPSGIIYITPEHKVTAKLLGHGAFGIVYLGYKITSREKVAAKHIPQRYYDDNQKVLLKREVSALKRLDHPNIVKLYEVIKTDSGVYIIMEYCEHSDLETYLRKIKELSEELMMRFIHQSAEAVFFMHTMSPVPIIHRDLKPANFLISTQDGQLQLKVADFGLARGLRQDGGNITTMHTAGTPYFMAPEVHRDETGRARYGKDADVFSLGIFILSLLNYNQEHAIKPIKVGAEFIGQWMRRLETEKTLAFPPTIHTLQDASHVSSLKTMVLLMIKRDHRQRIDMSNVCQHIVRINNELRYKNDTRVLHSSLTDVGFFVLVKLSSTVVDVTGPLRIVVGPYPGIGVIDSNQQELMMYNLNRDDDQINLSWKKAIPRGFDENSLQCLDERGNIYMQKDQDTIHVFANAFHPIHTLPARGKLIYFIYEGFRIYATRSPQPVGSNMWKLSLNQSDGTIVHTFQDREYESGDFRMVVDPVDGRTVISDMQQKLLQIHDATGALEQEVKLDYKPGRPACTQDNIFIPVVGEARVEVYSWGGARFYSLDHDELGISSTADWMLFTPVCENRTLLLVMEPSGEVSLHAYRNDGSSVLTSCSMDTTE